MRRAMNFLSHTWRTRGCLGKALVGLATLMLLACPCVFVSVIMSPATPTPKPTPAPTRLPGATVPAAVPTNMAVAPTATPSLLPVPTYTSEVEDVSVARAVRFAVTVVIEFPVSVEQIGSVCQEVVRELKKQKPLNAVAVFLYDTRSLLSAGYSIAKCEYAPRGEWAEAVNVQAGDYSTHEFVYEYHDKVHEPEQALLARPSEEEHKLAQEWDELSFKLIEEGEDPTAAEDIAFEQVAQSHGVSVQSLRDVVFKVVVWTFR